MPNPDPFRIRFPNDTPTTDKQHAENWRAVADWDRRLAPTGRTLINAVRVVSPVNTIDFRNIPPNFNSLIIKINAACDGVAGTRQALDMQFNGDVGNNYWWQLVGSITGTGPSVFVGNAVSFMTVANIPGTTASRSGFVEIVIPDYASKGAGNKAAFFHTGNCVSSMWDTTSATTFSGGFWWQTSVAPINYIHFFVPALNFIAPTTALLYGEY